MNIFARSLCIVALAFTTTACTTATVKPVDNNQHLVSHQEEGLRTSERAVRHLEIAANNTCENGYSVVNKQREFKGVATEYWLIECMPARPNTKS